MYSSLDRADIGIDEDGARIAVQTDHRDLAEIEDAYDLSVIFALTRAINPVRTEQFDRARFTFLQGAPERLLEVLHLAGAEVEVMTDDGPQLVPGPQADPERADALAAASLRALGARIFADRHLPVDGQGLAQLLVEYARRVADSGGREEDEITYWECVVELGAAVGEILCVQHGAIWSRDPQFFGMIPYMPSKGGGLTNVFDKVERYFQHGASESPQTLLRMMEDDGVEPGKVMFNLRPHDWHGREHAHHTPLLAMDDRDMPVIALVHDLPNTTRTIPSGLSDDELADLQEQARANIAALPVQVEEIEAGPMTILVTHGDYYASEKLLDPGHMADLAGRLGAEMLLASVPVKGSLWVATALTAPEAVAVFQAVIAGQHERAARNEQLSTEVFLVQGGEVVGVARAQEGDDDEVPEPAVDESAAEPPKKSFWARLFGG